VPAPKSQAQANLIGVIAGHPVRSLRGKAATAYRKGLTKGVARSMLRGVSVKSLPPRYDAAKKRRRK
jgi:hypothetical protein